MYVVAAEPLVQVVLKNKETNAINIPNSNDISKMYAHADDFTLTVDDKNSINEIFRILNLHSEASGAKINKQKSEIMCLGTGSISDNEIKKNYGIKLCEDVTQILGIYMGKNSEVCQFLNWK